MQPDIPYKPVPESTAVIKKVHELTAHYWLKTKLGNGMLIVAEIVCYLLFIGLLVLAIFIPNGTITIDVNVSDEATAATVININKIVYFFLIVRIATVVLGLLMLVPARLFRKLRKKNNVLEEVNRVCGEYLEKVS